tara:strand:+ start:56 stop:829 length:774 start_codon:yes stop_codon:yes gene_type:complete
LKPRKKNVLVTGSKGFLGTNLINYLSEKKSLNIFEYTRKSSLEDLNAYIEKIDFIFHFAGLISPIHSEEEFKDSNTNLTSEIIKLLSKKKLSTPILFTSSIHAKEKLGYYGLSKSESEDLLIQYSSDSNSPVYIFRLPHVYGEYQNINRGSFLTDSIYNILNGLEINMKNPNNTISYVYVKDLVQQFYEIFNLHPNCIEQVYPEVKNIDKAKVGDVISYISILNSNSSSNIELSNNKFKMNLEKVFKHYYEMLNNNL